MFKANHRELFLDSLVRELRVLLLEEDHVRATLHVLLRYQQLVTWITSFKLRWLRCHGKLANGLEVTALSDLRSSGHGRLGLHVQLNAVHALRHLVWLMKNLLIL
jgi:hypothetical protein